MDQQHHDMGEEGKGSVAGGASNSSLKKKKTHPNDAIMQESASRHSPVKLWKALFVVLILLNAIQQFSMQNIRG